MRDMNNKKIYKLEFMVYHKEIKKILRKWKPKIHLYLEF